MDKKELSYRIFCYFNKRKLNNGGRTVISVKTFEEYCGVPIYTVQHLVSLRRLISDKFIDIVSNCLEKDFGFDPNITLSKNEIEEMDFYELFN